MPLVSFPNSVQQSNQTLELKGRIGFPGPILLLLLILSGCTGSCNLFHSSEPQYLVIATYNLHNLMDDVLDGTEYPEFRPSSPFWNTKKYLERLGRLHQVVASLWDQGPDILVFTEIENSRVLEDLHRLYLYKLGYRYMAITQDSGSAIQIGVLSKHQIIHTQAIKPQDEHNLHRSILETLVQIQHRQLRIFSNHWKSKAGGSLESTEQGRRASSQALLARLYDLHIQQNKVPILLTGDFNSRRNESSFTGLGHTTALVYLKDRDTPLPAGSIGVTSNQGLMFSRDQELIFYSPWLSWIEKDRFRYTQILHSITGSYFFQGDWEDIDHFFLCSNLIDSPWFRVHGFFVAGFDFLLTTDGTPKGYNVRTGQGYSDHLPIVLLLGLE
jgi:endonuclease/exonuclease/phosphatase family metal-dependent hydrolase